jgi:phage terminase large subunit-like protein
VVASKAPAQKGTTKKKAAVKKKAPVKRAPKFVTKDPLSLDVDIKKLSPADREKLLAHVREAIQDRQRVINELKALNPFWWYVPSNGDLTPEGIELLQDYLKPEDIPQGRLDSQLDYHLSTAPIRGASGGNQSGKSVCGAIDCLIDGTGALPESLKDIYPKEKLPTEFPRFFRYVTVDHTTFLNTVIPTFQHWTPKEYLIDGSWDKSYKEEGKEGQRVLKLGQKGKHLCSIEFMTNEMKVAKFQGPPRHKVIYDEEPRQEIYKENLLRFTTSSRLDISFNFTPTNGLSWATDLFEDGQDERGQKVELFKFCSVCNPQANLSTLRGILDEITDYNELKMRLLGEFISLSGLVYGRLFNPHIHVIDPFVADRDGYLVLLGLDPHLVTRTAAVFLAVDREGNKYVLDSYFEEADTEKVKAEICKIFIENDWRWGWSVADRSSNTSIIAFGGKNIFMELARHPNAIKALRTSEKFEGSIKAGVDEIKRALKVNEETGKPTLFICNTPSNRMLIQSFRTLERDTYNNEDKMGMKDRIKEGKHHLHAALRYLFQYPLTWYPAVDNIPQPAYDDEAACW